MLFLCLLNCDRGHFSHETIATLYSLDWLFRVTMASDDIAQLADTLAKTHVGDEELTIKGLGLKLDNAASGQTKMLMDRPVFWTCSWTDLSSLSILLLVLCPSGGAGP